GVIGFQYFAIEVDLRDADAAMMLKQGDVERGQATLCAAWRSGEWAWRPAPLADRIAPPQSTSTRTPSSQDHTPSVPGEIRKRERCGTQVGRRDKSSRQNPCKS